MIKRICCIAAALLMMVSLIGCDKTEKLVGTWETDADISGFVRASIEKELGTEGTAAFNIENLTVTMLLTFEDDGTYHMELSEDSVSGMKETLVGELKDGFAGYMDVYLKENGYDSLDEIVASAGMDAEAFKQSADEYLDGLEDTLDVTDYVRKAITSGTYCITDGKLYMTKEGESIDETEPYEDYRVTEDTLTLVSTEELNFTKVIDEE